MLINYFKIALRNLSKNKLFSLINIAGMAISLAGFSIFESSLDESGKYLESGITNYELRVTSDE